jgi:hypothetical protein
VPTRSSLSSSRPSRSMQGFKDFRPSAGSPRLSPARAPMRSPGADMRAAPRAVRPTRR